MTDFPVHTIDFCPLTIRSRAVAAIAVGFSGMIPNIAGAMATSSGSDQQPSSACSGTVHGGSFTEAQVQSVLLTDAVTNALQLGPVAFHTALAAQGRDRSSGCSGHS